MKSILLVKKLLGLVKKTNGLVKAKCFSLHPEAAYFLLCHIHCRFSFFSGHECHYFLHEN